MTTSSFSSRAKILSTLVLMCGLVCFFLGGIILITHEPLLTSRRLVDRLIFALPTQFFLSLLGVSKHKRIFMGYFFLAISFVLFVVSLQSGSGRVRSLLLAALWGGAGRYIYHAQKQRLAERRSRSARSYIGSKIGARGSYISFLTTASIISTIGSTGINCEQIESSLRLSGIQEQITDTTLGSLLGADTLSEMISSGTGADITNSASGNNETGLLGLISLAKSQIYDLVIEQNEQLNHSLCELVNDQLITIQDRPLWQIAGIVLLYIIIRPLVTLLIMVCLLIWMLIRKLLVVAKLLKKEKKRVRVTGIVLE